MRYFSSRFLANQRTINEAEGYPLVLPDSIGGYLADYTIYGTDGGVGDLITDTTDANNGKYKIQTQTKNKNLIEYPYTHSSRTISGIAFTVNEDGSVSLKGTATARATFYLKSATPITMPAGTYILSGCPDGGSTSSYCLSLRAFNNYNYECGEGLTLTSSNPWSIEAITINVYAGTTVDTTFYPQLEIGSYATDYEKPVPSITTNMYLDEPLYSGDEINYKADGLPSVPTVQGTTVITTNTAIEPSSIHAEYYEKGVGISC